MNRALGSNQTRDDHAGVQSWLNNRRLAQIIVGLTFTGLTIRSHYALLSFFLDYLPAASITCSSIGLGIWLTRWLKLETLPFRWRILLAAGIGLGIVPVIVLAGGAVGSLHRELRLGSMILFCVLGAVQLRGLLQGLRHSPLGKSSDAATADEAPSPRLLWFLVCPFLILTLIAASNAPGLIWKEEGFGYDVLEYHLQVPKEYFLNGRISYLLHNVYANFPEQVELLYLLVMIVLGDPIDAGPVANMIHLQFAMLTVFAAWVAGRDISRTAGIFAAVAAATCGWLTYLSGLAYVENAMLFFGMTAVAALLRALSEGQTPGQVVRWAGVSGAFAGFACGCKYTAVILFAVPIVCAWVTVLRGSPKHRATAGVLCAMCALATFLPWLIKNAVLTGNPVFPLLNERLDANPPGWGPEQTELWERGHSLRPEEETFVSRLEALWQHVPADHDQRFGPALLLLPFLGLLGRPRDRRDAALLVVLIVQLAAWLFLTHLYARFAVAMIVPLVLLCARAPGARPMRQKAFAAALAIGALWNLYFVANLLAENRAEGAPPSVFTEGQVPGYEYISFINHELPESAKVLLVGEARAFYFTRPVDYCVVFNKNPFVEAIRAAKSDEEIVAWLRASGYTHVLVHWGEIRRLAATYGFAKEITPTLFERLCHAGLAAKSTLPNTSDLRNPVRLFALRQ